MGSEISRKSKRQAAGERRRLSHGRHSDTGVSLAQRPTQSSACCGSGGAERRPRYPETAEESGADGASVSVFMPEFPQCQSPEQDHFQVLGFIAKGSYGPIMKVKDNFNDKVFAVKVLPKLKVVKQEAVEQLREEVIIQRQVKHPFILSLQDCWQTQHHLVIMSNYCSFGDLHTHWMLKGQFEEREVRLFAAELGCALGYLHELGIVHRDVKLENILLSDRGHLLLSDFGLSRRLRRGGRAFTICGTIQYMAPEVLSGGPYNHAADWWSLGITLLSLVTGKFPIPAELDHNSMLDKVRDFPYDLPRTLSSALTLLLTELLCKNPETRLRDLERFKMQPLFRCSSFDPLILQKEPVDVILKLRTHPDWTATAERGFENFDCVGILQSPQSHLVSALSGMKPSDKRTLE
ncbi:ribosomal protein S6 kinase-related protein-like [Nelusetta ayraudi]|uniref:ribosomal protein S6 kinase-related protein-like n=1 Tax=Nelusetta ayraudi TaxID=303726 RepID=UPI003F72858A